MDVAMGVGVRAELRVGQRLEKGVRVVWPQHIAQVYCSGVAQLL